MEGFIGGGEKWGKAASGDSGGKGGRERDGWEEVPFIGDVEHVP